MAKLTVADIQKMKRDGVKIAAAITYDYQQAQILDRAGIDILTVGDSIGRNRFGQLTHHETSVDLMVLACGAVSRGAKRALVNCDMPCGPPQEGPDAAVRAAIRLVKEATAIMRQPPMRCVALITTNRVRSRTASLVLHATSSMAMDKALITHHWQATR